MELWAGVSTRRGILGGTSNSAVFSGSHIFDVLWKWRSRRGGIASSNQGTRKSRECRSRRERILWPGIVVAGVATPSTGGQNCATRAEACNVPDDGSAASRAVRAGACRGS